MKVVVNCSICNQSKTVNGQKQIELFSGSHHHNLSEVDLIINNHISISYPEESNKPQYYPGCCKDSVRDYWHKVSG